MVFSPAYDLVAIALVNPADDEDLALTLKVKKKKIKKVDFVAALDTLRIEVKQRSNIFDKMEKRRSKWIEQIDNSFLRADFKTKYKTLIEERFTRLA